MIDKSEDRLLIICAQVANTCTTKLQKAKSYKGTKSLLYADYETKKSKARKVPSNKARNKDAPKIGLKEAEFSYIRKELCFSITERRF